MLQRRPLPRRRHHLLTHRQRLPWGTFTINISGSFALGILSTQFAGTTLLLTGTACIGSYTTFSTWMLETDRLGEDNDRRPLVLYLLGSLAVGLAAAACGRILGHSQ